jgi:hypothetical protein
MERVHCFITISKRLQYQGDSISGFSKDLEIKECILLFISSCILSLNIGRRLKFEFTLPILKSCGGLNLDKFPHEVDELLLYRVVKMNLLC